LLRHRQEFRDASAGENRRGSKTTKARAAARASYAQQRLPDERPQTIPNVFFHVLIAYDILRHNGVDLGKRDFLDGGRDG
jgi:Domain of unknown function (DUF1993)